MLHYKFEDAVNQLKTVSKDDLYTGDGFECIDVVPGEKCNNGGEYVFYTTYSPTTKSGNNKLKSISTCDYDICGT